MTLPFLSHLPIFCQFVPYWVHLFPKLWSLFGAYLVPIWYRHDLWPHWIWLLMSQLKFSFYFIQKNILNAGEWSPSPTSISLLTPFHSMDCSVCWLSWLSCAIGATKETILGFEIYVKEQCLLSLTPLSHPKNCHPYCSFWV